MTRKETWERERASFIARLIREEMKPTAPLRVLNLNAGDGFLARQVLEVVPPGSEVVSFDPGLPREHQSSPTVGTVRSTEAPPAGQFDVLLIIDVMERVEDDRGFLHQLVEECLRVGGAALVVVPALSSLYSWRDEALGRLRRYDAEKLRRMMWEAGLLTGMEGGLFHFSLLFRVVERACEVVIGRRGARSIARVAEARREGGPASGAFGACLLQADGRLSALAAGLRWRLPGLNAWALGRKALP
jgi:methyltransferase family protein